MTRLARKIALMAEIETTYGGGLPTAATWSSALQVLPRSRPRHRIRRMNEPRDLYTRVLGESDEIPGPRVQEIEFEIELAASGSAGTPPPWGKLLRACQFAETTFAGRVEYTPVSDPGESLVIRYWEDGHAYIARGCRGTVKFDLTAFRIPRATFRFEGFDASSSQSAWDGPSNPFAAWQTPLLPQTANSGDILLGCSYSGGVITGGTAYPSKGFTLDMGHELTYDAILGAEKVVVTQRRPKGEMLLELTAAQEQTWRTEMNASVETSFGWQIGTGAGNRIVVFGRRLQRQEAQGVEDAGFRRTSTQFALIFDPVAPSDDFMRIVVR